MQQTKILRLVLGGGERDSNPEVWVRKERVVGGNLSN